MAWGLLLLLCLSWWPTVSLPTYYIAYCTCYVKKDKETVTVVYNFLCQVIVWTHYSLRTWVKISSYKLESSRRGLIGLRTETIVTARSTGNTQWREMSTQRGNTKTTGTNKCQKQMSWQTKTDAVRSVLKGGTDNDHRVKSCKTVIQPCSTLSNH